MNNRRSLIIQLVLIVLLSIGSVLASLATNSSPTLGLDLQGGFSVVLDAREINGELPSEEAVDQAKDIISQRVDALGVAEPDIVRQGRTVIIQLPGVTDRAKAEQVVGCTAKLEFRPVLAVTPNPDALDTEPTPTEPEGDGESKATTTTKPKATTTVPPDDGEDETGMGTAGLAAGEGALPAQFAPTTTTTTEPPTTTTEPPATTTEPAPVETTTTVAADGGEAPTQTAAGSSGCDTGEPLSEEAIAAATPPPEGGILAPSQDGSLIYTLGPVGFTGDALSSADAALSEGWVVNASVRGSARGEANAAFNACYNGEAGCPAQEGGRGSIAIILDGEVISAPAVNAPDLASDNFTISGDFDQGEAKDLALVLRYGSLPVEFEQVALQQVSATLGADSLRSGMIAGAIGLVAVALYMLLYYRVLGFVVLSGLAVWAGLMYGVVSWLSVTQGLALTLSGIIGMVISVGTSVDAYVVYFERLRDEVRTGRSVRSSSERGFKSAYRTIFAAAVTSFIGAFLLWFLTVGAVRGFAFFLGISVLLNLVVTYFFTRPLVILLSRSKWFATSGRIGVRDEAEPAAAVEGAPS